MLEGGQRVFVVRRDEHDVGESDAVWPLFGQFLGRFQARLARHLDVEK